MTDTKEAVLTLLAGILKTCPTECDHRVTDIIAEFQDGDLTIDDVGAGLGSIMSDIYNGEEL